MSNNDDSLENFQTLFKISWRKRGGIFLIFYMENEGRGFSDFFYMENEGEQIFLIFLHGE